MYTMAHQLLRNRKKFPHPRVRSTMATSLTSSISPQARSPGSERRVTETVAAIVAAHRAGRQSPAQTVARSFKRIREHNDPAIFISLRDEKDAIAEAEALSAKDAAQLPLLGVPVAVKDNIDVAGLPTTAACPAYAYTPTRDATVGGAAAPGRRHRDRQDQSRSVRNRPRRRALALRHSRQSDARRSHSRRIEFRIGGGRFGGTGAALARHRYGRSPAACRRCSTTSSD